MRLRLVRSLLAALAAIAVTATLAGAQEADHDALPRVSGDSLDAARPLEAPERQARLAEPPAANATTTAFRLPLMVFSMGAAADWTSTAWALGHPAAHEDNPTIAWAKSPAGIIAAGVGIDVVGAYAWMKATRNHPKLQATGFVVAAVFRGYLVIQNIRNNGDRGPTSQRRP
jgi:hypothetical protein